MDIGTELLQGTNINNRSNAFLAKDLNNYQFNRLKMSINVNTEGWPHVYRLKTFEDPPHAVIRAKIANGAPIMFGHLVYENLPDPRICNLHYHVARVVHACAMGEALDKVYPSDEEAPIFGHLRERPYSQNVPETLYFRSKLQEIVDAGGPDFEDWILKIGF